MTRKIAHTAAQIKLGLQDKLLLGNYLTLPHFRGDIALDRVGVAFLAWLLLLAPWAYLADVRYGAEALIGLREWVRLLMLAVVYLVTFHLAKQSGHWKVLYAVLASSLIPLAARSYQLITPGMEWARNFWGASGTTLYNTIFGAYLVVMIGVAWWAFAERRQRWRTLWIAALVLLAAALFHTGVRTGLGLFVVLILGLVVYAKRPVYRWGTAFVAVTFLLAAWQLPPFSGRLHSLFQAQFEPFSQETLEWSQRTGYITNSVDWRITNWLGLLRAWGDKAVLGYGLGTAEQINPLFPDTTPHNDYVRTLVETGLVGFAIFLGFLAVVGVELWLRTQTAPDESLRMLNVVGWLLFLGWAVGMLFDNLMTHTMYQVYLWATLGAAGGAVTARRQGELGTRRHGEKVTR